MSENNFPNIGSVRNKIWRITPIAVVVLFALFFPLIASPGARYLAIMALVGAILAQGLNIFFGYCGQINFGCAGFFAVGAYSVGILEKYFHLPFFVNLLLALIITGIVTWLISHFLLRLRHYMLGLGTLAFALAIHTAVSKGSKGLTGGEDGIDLAHLVLFGSKMGDFFYYYLLLAIVGLCWWVSYALRHSRIGRAMVGIGQNETVSISLGVEINKLLLLALLLNGLMAGLAGGIYVKWIAWISPEYFSIMTNVVVLLGVVLGGTGSSIGVIIGGMLMFILPHLLITFAKYQVLIYGVILTVSILFLPNGIVGGLRSIACRYRKLGKDE